jgi:hypothetical protein
METKTNADGNGKAEIRRKIVTTAIVIVVVLGLVLAARFLVSTVDIVEFLKRMHGG